MTSSAGGKKITGKPAKQFKPGNAQTTIMNAETAREHRDAGVASYNAGNYYKAIEHSTKAIKHALGPKAEYPGLSAFPKDIRKKG